MQNAPAAADQQRQATRSHATADKLRANVDAAEYKHLVLGLSLLKYISDTFTARRADIGARLNDPAAAVELVLQQAEVLGSSWS